MFTKKVIILTKYLNFIDIFSKQLAKKLPKYFSIKKYTINLKEDKQLLYMLIYSFILIKLEILKIYIKINLPIALFCYSNLLLILLLHFSKS